MTNNAQFIESVQRNKRMKKYMNDVIIIVCSLLGVALMVTLISYYPNK